ncbi:hypothetical protein [Azospirillum halopraeferens]|uniref:hypothetical protein n=1 Tax=Azospirillum halopraeferens TaxID=34010 RepID=UPI0004098B71|nr:hypothetical protein [Azospirillum halopraeferens]
MLESLSPAVLAILLFGPLALWPAMRILRRAGFNPWIGLAVLVPVVGVLVVYMVLGHRRWPNLPARAPRRTPKTRRTL